jgi:hypothetical protein
VIVFASVEIIVLDGDGDGEGINGGVVGSGDEVTKVGDIAIVVGVLIKEVEDGINCVGEG